MEARQIEGSEPQPDPKTKQQKILSEYLVDRNIESNDRRSVVGNKLSSQCSSLLPFCIL